MPRSASGAGELRPAEDLESPGREAERADLAATSSRRSLAPVAVAPAVIPLVHAPDDPGPEPDAQGEPAPDSTGVPPSDGWSRIRSLFRP
jgi:hypothetical protein